MEIFMCNVSWNADEHQVTRELASILHSPHYEQLIPRMNFNVHLFRDKTRIHSHRGMGFLTLPTENIGNEFLSDYGDMSCKSLIFYGRRIKFSKSQRSGCNPELLKTITLKPYMDPQYLKERESKAQRLKAGYIQLKTIQFGWMCRDDVFSIEWESHSSIILTLSFDPDRSEIRIVLEQPRSPDQYTIAIRYNQISFVSAYHHSEEPTVYLSLSQPPRFEHQYPNTLCQRLSHLPFGDHDRVAPYTSIAIRLICSGNGDITRFNYLFQEANLHTKIDDYFLPTDHRELFSRRSIEQYDEWIESLPWIVAFQVEAIVRNLIADFCEILSLKGNILEVINRYGDAYAAELLKHFSTHVNDALLAYNNTEANVHMYFQKLQNDYQGFRIMQPLQPTDASLFQALHVTITPTTMQLSGPFLERSNRVIRSYPPPMHDSFLRVNFNDEGGLFFRFDRDIDGPKFIRNRIGSLLFKGLLIAGRLFRFLAYSQSSLKEHSVWFVKDFTDQNNRPVTAAIIIANLGRFTDLQFDSKLIYCPARYAARLSQAFTATDTSVAVELEEIQPIDDIQTEDGKYTFTDGVGTISTDLARDMWKELKKTRRKARASKAHPKAFQIRFQGSKGMLSINYKLSGHTLCLRPSMIKFEDPHSMQIEIAQAFDRPSDYFLNRPLITLLEGLGVPFETFKRYQDIAVKQTEAAVISVGTAAKMLESHGLGSPFRVPSTLLSLKKHVTDNLHFDPFYRKSMEVAVYHNLRELKNHARIPVPGGWTLVGVADEHGYLKEGEIFACVKPRMGRVQYLEGSILISRSPTIHPGDIQIVRAIGPPPRGSCFERESLENTVVFSTQGERPLPSCLGGGDLDGDPYNLLPLDLLPEFKPKSTFKPAAYEPAPKKLLDRPSTMQDVADFVLEFINSDVVGIIAIHWLIIADQSDNGIHDPDCMQLAQLHSDAVDYPKSGQPVKHGRIPKLKFRERPDWIAPETAKEESGNYYQSRKALGQLFRSIKLPEVEEYTRPKRSRRRRHPVREHLQEYEREDNLDIQDYSGDIIDLEVNLLREEYLGNRTWVSEATQDMIKQIYPRYVNELRAICTNYSLSHSWTSRLTEEEVFIGTIMAKTSQPRKRKEMISKLREQTDLLVRGVKEELLFGDQDIPPEELLERACIAWHLASQGGMVFGAQSFRWIALGSVFEAVKEIDAAHEMDARNRFY